MPSPTSSYDGWSREDLIARISELEVTKARPKQRPPSPKFRAHKIFDFAAHKRRKIALKFCYSGWEYGGLAFQNMKTALPTVEGVLFDALAKARLIDPAGGFEGCGWEKCGRTDRGVSAAGQVISLWIRSALGSKPTDDVAISNIDLESDKVEPAIPESKLILPESPDGPSRPEHDYLSIINRLLPPTIRIIAWSPVETTFSARFSCTHRHYKYFFSAATISGPSLDIDRMREAASRLVGEHDFRNLCKLDPAKQITMFRRKVMHADIEPLTGGENDQGMYVFNLIGSAFLYHQVRHIMAVLFLVGSGLEDPSVATALMNVEEGLEADPRSNQDANISSHPLEIVDRKPEYQMADALPLILWDCGYPEGDLNWRTTPTEDRCISKGNCVSAEAGTELYQQLHAISARSQVHTVLNNHFLQAVSKFHQAPPAQETRLPIAPPKLSASPKLLIPLGGGTYKRTGKEKYVPLLQRNRLDSVDVTNERWRLGKGFRRNERRKASEITGDDDLDGNE